ncbi:hypothetical protein KKF84_13990 [Myxococcota bacterium]|nr:hypothetical protein [Myxococcota bacterium]MBU1536433.1 hypothetical protein [Myxococcota bacterium]
MESKATVRHTLFNMFKQYFSEILGTVAYHRFLSLLPAQEKMIMAQSPDLDEWITARSLSVVFAAVDIHITNQMSDFGFEMGKYFVETFRDEIFMERSVVDEDSLERLADPENQLNTGQLRKLDIAELRVYSSSHLPNISRVVKMYGQNLTKWFRPLEMEIDQRMSGTSFSVILMDRPVKLPLFCEFFMGILVGFLDNLHIGEATITKETCLLEGEGACVFSIYYGESSPLDFL